MVKPLPYLLLRLLTGMSFFGHGLVRIPRLEKFSGWMVGEFQNSMLPDALVRPFSYMLPFGELITGLLLIIGLFTKQALVAGTFIMLALLFGSSMIEEWGSIPSQLLHGLLLVLLLQFIEANRYSLDYKRQ